MREPDTSRRYHRRARGPRVRGFGFNQQDQSQNFGSFFGGLPGKIASKEWNQLFGPLTSYLGFGAPAGSAKGARQEAKITGGTGPLADIIRQFRQYEPQIFGQAEQAGGRVSAAGSQLFTDLQSQIMQSLQGLPSIEAAASAATDYANQFAKQAFSPVQDQALYQDALQRALTSARPGEAARGQLATGAGAQSEQDIATQLAMNFAARQQGEQAQAIPLLGGAATTAGNLAQVGPALAAGGLNALPQFAQALQAQYGLPMSAIQSIIGMIMGQAPGATQLLSATGPSVLSRGSGFGFNIA